MRATLLIRGTGDVGSAVAVVLVRAGYGVALHDEPAPSATRRGMAFADAVFDGSALLAGMSARRVGTLADLADLWEAGEIPVAVSPFDDLLRAAGWRALVDARMRKRAMPERATRPCAAHDRARPEFRRRRHRRSRHRDELGRSAGRRARHRVAVASAGRASADRRHCPGTLRLRAGRRPFRDIPADRRSRRAGRRGGDDRRVPLQAPFAGVIRGLTHDGVDVARHTKVIEVDPRGDPAAAFGLGARPQRIAEGVLNALTRARVSVAA